LNAAFVGIFNVGRAQEVQAAITAHAKDEGTRRHKVEADVKKKAWHPKPEEAAA